MHANKRGYLFLSLCLTGCAYVGEPLYPALNIPGRVVDLNVVERGSHLDIYFTMPELTTEGLGIKQIGGIDLRIGPSKSDPFNTGPFNMEQWAASAAKIPVAVPDKPGLVHVPVPVRALVGQDLVLGVRIGTAKGRRSEWSNLKSIEVKPPLATPIGEAPEPVAQGVQLKWKAAGEPAFRVYRKAEKELLAVKLADVKEPRYLDTTTQYGTRYEYWVQGFDGNVESELAGPFAIQPEDTFAPAVPAGVAASAGLQTVELAWERNSEADFKGYRVYRATGDGPFERIADRIEAPSFSDNKIESGKHYRYAVSSVDQSGNESEKSAPVEIAAP
ncbi:MAG: fibronectin type III domain-containing protein [Bryobacteraceae bacterium]